MIDPFEMDDCDVEAVPDASKPLPDWAWAGGGLQGKEALREHRPDDVVIERFGAP